MTQYTIPRSWTIGFDSIFDRLESTQSNNSTYPPHNVVKHTDTSFEIALAVAGFKDKDLDVTLEKSILTIEGDNVSLNGDKEYIHKGIAKRSFNLGWKIDSKFDLSTATADFKNGLLQIVIPYAEGSKPKTLKIK